MIRKFSSDIKTLRKVGREVIDQRIKDMNTNANVPDDILMGILSSWSKLFFVSFKYTFFF